MSPSQSKATPRFGLQAQTVPPKTRPQSSDGTRFTTSADHGRAQVERRDRHLIPEDGRRDHLQRERKPFPRKALDDTIAANANDEPAHLPGVGAGSQRARERRTPPLPRVVERDPCVGHRLLRVLRQDGPVLSRRRGRDVVDVGNGQGKAVEITAQPLDDRLERALGPLGPADDPQLDFARGALHRLESPDEIAPSS